MKKERIEKIILIALLFCGLNYMLFSFYFKGQFQQLSGAKKAYNNILDKVTELRFKKVQVKNLVEENNKLKDEMEKLDISIPKSLNTPQIIYDFYTACKRFNISGESLDFKKEIEAETQTQTEPVANSSTENTTQPLEQGFHSIEITLSFTGDRDSVEKFLKNLEKITPSKLDVKRVTIAAKEGELTSTDDSSSKSQALKGEITFIHYVQQVETSAKSPEDYEFYNSTLGFDKITDMFDGRNKIK